MFRAGLGRLSHRLGRGGFRQRPHPMVATLNDQHDDRPGDFVSQEASESTPDTQVQHQSRDHRRRRPPPG